MTSSRRHGTLESVYGITQDTGFLGSPRKVVSNPYVHFCALSQDLIRKTLGDIRFTALFPVSISPSEGASLSETLLNADPAKKSVTPPPVSSGEWSKRLTVDVKHEGYLALGVLFDLDEKFKDDIFISYLLEKTTMLCSLFDTHDTKIFTPDTTKSELTNEQELFASVLKALVPPPYAIHSQVETVGDFKLPQTKFDLVVSQPFIEKDRVLVIVENDTFNESPQLLLSNKTDKTQNLFKMNVSVVLEALIFSEFCERDAVPVICTSGRGMRPMLYFKETDTLLTTSEVAPWQSSDQVYDIKTCITFLLFLCAGKGFFPEFNKEYMIAKPLKPGVGWKEAYKNMPNYVHELRQTVPTSSQRSSSRGASLQGTRSITEAQYSDDVALVKKPKLK